MGWSSVDTREPADTRRLYLSHVTLRRNFSTHSHVFWLEFRPPAIPDRPHVWQNRTGNWTLKSLAILQTAFEVTVMTKELNAWCILDYWNLDISLFLNCSATVMIQGICLYHHEVTTMGSLLHWAEPKPNCSSWDMTRHSTIKTRLRVWVCSFCTLRFLRVALVGCPILCWDSEVALQISSVV